MMTFWTKFNRTLRAFRTARAGNVAITFAFATLPIVGFVGFAVDYSHANSVKAAMQAALDSTALMLSKDAATATNSALQTEALNYFSALFTRPEATNVTINTTYTTSGGSQVVVTGSANVSTSFLGVIGYNNIVVNGSSTAKWGSSRLRVALALDNTGSMADDGKMTALKSATKGLLTQLQNAAVPMATSTSRSFPSAGMSMSVPAITARHGLIGPIGTLTMDNGAKIMASAATLNPAMPPGVRTITTPGMAA